MEFLIINHAKAQKQKGVYTDPDGALMDIGMKQVCLTGAWIKYNFSYKDFTGYTSPYLRSLQTASAFSEILDIDFKIDINLREFEFINTKEIKISNRSLQFDNLHWPIKEWSDDKEFKSETITPFIERCVEFLEKLKENKENKIMIVSHSIPCIALSQLIIGKNIEDIRKICVETQKIISRHSGSVPDHIAEQMVYLTGMKPCGLTWIKDKEPIWFSRVVYE